VSARACSAWRFTGAQIESSTKHMTIPSPTPPLNARAKLSIAALLILGLLGGSLIVAHSGFETSPRRGGSSTFVPAPEAYVIAVALYLMSCLALAALLREWKAAKTISVAAFAACGLIAWGLVHVLS